MRTSAIMRPVADGLRARILTPTPYGSYQGVSNVSTGFVLGQKLGSCASIASAFSAMSLATHFSVTPGYGTGVQNAINAISPLLNCLQKYYAHLLFLVLMVSCPAGAVDRVSARDGRIFIQDSSGQTITLTQTGLDSDPWLSPDGRTLVFIRRSAENMFRTSVYKIDLPTRTLSLLYRGPIRYQGRESFSFGRPELDDSQETLFVLIREYATEGSLMAIRSPSGQELGLAGGGELDVEALRNGDCNAPQLLPPLPSRTTDLFLGDQFGWTVA